MKTGLLRTILGGMLASLGLIGQVHAALLTFNFSGTFSSQLGLTPNNFVGATTTGSYTFDTTTADSNGTSETGQYTDTLTALSGTVTWGGGSFNFAYGATDGNILVENNFVTGPNFRDRYEVRAGGGDGVFDNDLPSYIMVAFNLTELATANPAPAFLTNDSLPLTPPSLFGLRTIGLTFQNPNSPSEQNKLDFTLTSLTTQVPEPTTLALLGLGLAGLGLSRRRQ